MYGVRLYLIFGSGKNFGRPPQKRGSQNPPPSRSDFFFFFLVNACSFIP